MSMKYTPTSFFKTMSNEVLKPIFDKNGIELNGVDWEKRVKDNDKSVVAAWCALRDEECKKKSVAAVHEVFQCISVLAKPVSEVNSLIHRFAKQGRFSHALPENIDELTFQEQAGTIYNAEGRRMLMFLVDAALAESITPNRWTEFGNGPKKPIVVTEEMKHALEAEVNKAYDGIKGGNCHVETYPLNDGITFFLCKMDDKPVFVENKKPGENDYGFEARICPFTTNLAYNFEKGKLGITGALPKKKMTALAAAASMLITGEETQLERLARSTYDLTELARIGYTFPALPGSGVSNIFIKTLVLRSDCTPDSEITFKNVGGGSAYDSIKEYHQGYHLPEGTFQVKRASIVIEFGSADIKSIKFELTPKTCTQTGLLDDQRKLVEKLIEQMGVEEKS